MSFMVFAGSAALMNLHAIFSAFSTSPALNKAFAAMQFRYLQAGGHTVSFSRGVTVLLGSADNK